MTRTRSAALGLACALALVLGACGAQPSASTAAQATGWQADMLAQVNANRANAGLAPVALCGTLGAAAQGHSQDQANTLVMSHTGSDGSTLTVRVNRAGYAGWRGIAENVAAGQPDVGSVVSAWMNSSGHRANILGGYTHVGFGQARGSNGAIYWTQDFGINGRC